MVLSLAPRQTIPVWSGEQPPEGANYTSVTIGFDGSNTQIEIDLTPLQNTGHFSAVQTMYLDNEANNVEAVLICEGSSQRLSIPATAKAYLPLLLPNPPKVLVSTNNTIVLTFFFINFFLPPAVWI